MSWGSMSGSVALDCVCSRHHRRRFGKLNNGTFPLTRQLRFRIFSLAHVVAVFHVILFCFPAKCKRYSRMKAADGHSFQDTTSQHKCDKSERNILFLNAMGGFSHASRCPSEPWILPWSMVIQQRPRVQRFTVLEIGCNKATDALMLMRLFTQNEAVDMVSWLKETGFAEFACPLDWGFWRKILQLKLHGLDSYRHFCLEPVQENFEQVSAAARKFGLDRLGLQVRHLALSSSNVPSTVEFPHGSKGQENIGIDVGTRAAQTYPVNVSTLDKFVSKERIEEVNILKIDTEGNDVRVLLGAVQTLTNLRPEYLTFENHKVGHWSKFDLKDVVDFLDNISYTCFWSTRNGTLVRISGCWDRRYSTMKGWSNVACYHRNSRELGMLMEQSCLDRQPGL